MFRKCESDFSRERECLPFCTENSEQVVQKKVSERIEVKAGSKSCTRSLNHIIMEKEYQFGGILFFSALNSEQRVYINL